MEFFELMKKTSVTLSVLLLLIFSSFGETESESFSVSGLNVDIDGNEQFDALTDGLLVLRSMFGLTGSPLISGAVASDAVYTDAEDIQSRITGLGNRLDIDNNGSVDALTDGLIILRYLFGLTGDTLITGVVATDAQRVSAADIESYIETLTSLDIEPPVFTSSGSFSAAENQTAIGTVTATDVDTDNSSINFTVSGSELLISSAGVLTFASAPDYETKTSYTGTVTATDGTNSTTQSIAINVTDVDDVAPAFSSSATFSAAENQTAIGTVMATDVDTDNSSITFTISGSELSITSAGVLTFASAPDYETKTSYTATVTATDGTNSTTQSTTVNVTDVDDVAPVFETIEPYFTLKNIGVDGSVKMDGRFTFSDLSSIASPILLNGGTYLFTDDGGINSDYSNSQKRAITFDAGENNHIYIRLIDFSLESTQYVNYDPLGITASDSITALSSASGNLNSSISPLLSNILYQSRTSSLYLGGDYPVYDRNFVETNDGYGSGGGWIFPSSSGVDSRGNSIGSENLNTWLEVKARYVRFYFSSDYSITKPGWNIELAPAVFTQTNNALTFSVAENQTAIGTVVATDIDSLSITFTVSGAELAITSDGVLTFVSAPDYEAKASYSAIITATDGTNWTSHDVTINVTNVNDNLPVFTSSTTFLGAENQTVIGTITATDADRETLSYSISGTDASSLSINSSSGVLSFQTAPDYETKTSFSVTITATDGTNSTTQSVTVNVTDLDDVAPVVTSSAIFSAAENQTAIGILTATDVDSSSTSFTVSGSELSITSAGVLTFASAPDFETKASYTATVTATDGTNPTTQSITVTITDVNEVPVFTSLTTFNAVEFQTSIGSVTASDPEGNALTFSVSGSELSSTSAGVLSFVSNADYASKSVYSASVTVTDGEYSSVQSIMVNVTQTDYHANRLYGEESDGAELDPEHTKGVYGAKHCSYKASEGVIKLTAADLTGAQRQAVYQNGQSIEINGLSYKLLCGGDVTIRHSIKAEYYPEWSADLPDHARDGLYGVSFYSRIMEDAEQIPTGTHGVWGQWLQPNRMHPEITFQSIEGGLGWFEQKFGRSKFPVYMANGATHIYNPNSSVQGWGFFERRTSCEYYGSVHIANKMLYPPNQIKFDEDQDARENNGGIFFGHGWIALPMIGGKERGPNAIAGAGEQDRSVNNGKLTWTFFADAKNFSGPVHAYVPEFWYRRLEKLNATEILDVIGFDSASAAAVAARDVYAGRITEDAFISVIKSESWYSDGTTDFESGPYYARKKDTMAFNSVFGVSTGSERDPFDAFTESDESGNLYLKTNVPQIPSALNLEPFTLSGRTYTRDYYNNFVNFFNSGDNSDLNLNTLALTEPLVSAKTSDVNGFSVSGSDDATFNLGMSIHTEQRNRGGNVYFDWQNSNDRGYGKYYKIKKAASSAYTFEKVQESEVPESLKTYKIHNLDRVTSIMPHVVVGNEGAMADTVEANTKEIFGMENVNFLDYSCWVCVEENGCDPTVMWATLDDGSEIRYRWYKFKDQPTMIQLKKEFPDIYTTEYVNALQAKIEFIHDNWYKYQDYQLSEESK